MTENTCRCSRPTEAYVCLDCLDELARALRDVPWLDDELDVTITKQRGIPTTGGSASRETALPWHEAAAEARRHLRALLVSWVLFCDEEKVRAQNYEPGLPADTMTAMSRWMLLRVDGLGLVDIGPDAVEEITDAVDTCRKVIDRAPDRWYAGPCDCGADLYAKRREGTVECRDCGATHDVGLRRAWLLAEAEDQLANAATVARAVSWLGVEPLTPSRVRKWAERGRIIAKAHDGKAPLYRIGDALDLLAREGRIGA